MRYLSNVWTLGIKELRVLARDRQAAALLFVMPSAFVFLLSLALGDIYAEKSGVKLPIVLEVEDIGPAAERLQSYLEERDELQFVARPDGLSDEELFQERVARALVRIPEGFSQAIERFVASSGEDELGDDRITWKTAPIVDASYRALVQTMLSISCARVVQDEIASKTDELAGEMHTLASQLVRMAEMLETTIGQLESTANQLRGPRSGIEEFAQAASAEEAARQEALRALEELGQPDGASQEEPWEGPEASSVPIESELIGIEEPVEVLSPEERQSLDELLAQTAEMESSTGQQDLEVSMESFLTLAPREGRGFTLPSPLQQNVPGWSLFAMFFIVIPISSALHRERNEGTIRRMLVMTTPKSAILLGKLVPYTLVGTLQFFAMVLVGMYGVPLVSEMSLDLGTNPIVLLPITIVAAFAATSYGLLVASLAKTPEQASAFGATSVVILSVLGGIMIPHFIMPPFLQQAAAASPIYWGHQAYLDAILHGATLAEVARPLYVLSGFAAVGLLVATRRIS